MPSYAAHNSPTPKLVRFFKLSPPISARQIWVRFFNSPSTLRNWLRSVFLATHLRIFAPAPQNCLRNVNTVQPDSGSFFQISSPAGARVWVRFFNSPPTVRNWLRSVCLARHLLLFASASQNWRRSVNSCFTASHYPWVRSYKLPLIPPPIGFEPFHPQLSPFLLLRFAKNALSSPFAPPPRTFPRHPTSSCHAKLFLVKL